VNMLEEYQRIQDNFQVDLPAQYNFARDVLDQWAESDPDLKAWYWIDDDGREQIVTYAELARRSRQVANLLTQHGVSRGDVVLLMLGRQLAWWEVVTACLRTGIIVAPATTQLSAKDIAYRVRAASAVAIITDQSCADRVDAAGDSVTSLKLKALVDCDRNGWLSYDAARNAADDGFDTADTSISEDALCYFTSGTTGYPKMVVHSQGYGLGHKVTGQYWLNLSKGDVHWNISDTGWAKAAWSSYFGPFNQGACLFIHHTSAFDPVSTLKLLEQHAIDTMCAAPTVYRMLVQQDLGRYDFGGLRHCVGAGEPLNPEVIEIWRRATGVTIRDGYGQTESVILCGSFPFIPAKAGSMGLPSPGVTLGIVDYDGNMLGDNTEGNLAVRINPSRPLGLFDRYRGDDNANAASFVGDWYLTGDRATRDVDGYYWFGGRADDVIISAGYRIGPFEVESALVEHPAVAEAAVVSSPDPVRGEVVKAFIILAPGRNGDDSLVAQLQNHVKAVTAPYKYPRAIEFVNSLPKTVSGKIRRVELRAAEWAGAGS
jgi:acyl-coenzyme A synthetase/AMP-(fatty) acid ligase